MDVYAIPLEDPRDFESGSLNKASNIRPNRIFTADRKIILYKAGHLKNEKIGEAISRIIDILNN